MTACPTCGFARDQFVPRADLDRAEQERDEARSYLDEATDGWNEATENLAQSEAREQRLREALTLIEAKGAE